MQREDIEQRIKLTYDTNANETSKEVNNLSENIDKTAGSTDKVTSAQGGLKKSMAASTDEVVKNGGAMGLLNTITSGYAQIVKDSLEAMVLFSKESKIGMGIQKAYTFVMGASTGAMKAFKVALISTGIGAIALALIMLIVNFQKVKDAVYNLIPGLKSLGDFFGKIIDAVTDFIGITSEAERTLEKLNKATQKMLSDNKDLLANFGDQLSDFQKKQVEIASSLAERIKEINDNEALSIEEKNNQIRLAQERAKRDLLKNIDDTNAEAEKKRKEESDKIDSEKQKEIQKELDRIEYEKKNPRKAVVEIGTTIIDPQEEILAKKLIDDQKILADRVTQDAIAGYAKEVREEDAENAKIVAEAKEAQYKTNLGNLQTILALGGKKLAAISKGLAIMDIVRSAYNSISSTISNIGIANAKAAAASPLTGGMPFVAINTAQGALSIGATIASSAMSIKSILGDSKSVSRSGSSNSGGSGASGASATPQVNFQGSKENQIGNTMAGKINEQAPIRVTVLENDITKVQSGVQAKVVSNSF